MIQGTSGDTGSAAIEAVKDLKRTDIIVLLPKGKTIIFLSFNKIFSQSDYRKMHRSPGTPDDNSSF